ncbi:carboxyl-terminal-processing peptidase 2 [Quercus suber]|uniref:Carboxyl-terminal-processing peptidase 2 n=1 Tax=Quercus suber TaxID=58331 RepID=A0AAW0KG81_QUESU
MEVLASSPTALLSPHFAISYTYKNPNFTAKAANPQVLPWKPHPIRIVEAQLRSRLLCKRTNARNKPRNCSNTDGTSKHYFLLQSISRLHKNLSSKCGFFSISYGRFKLGRYSSTLQKVIDCSEKIRRHVSVLSVHLLVGVMLVMSLSVSVRALTEENLLFLEAWRTIDRAYVDKTFNGQSWFRQSGTQGALTGVGLSIGYPTQFDGSPAGLVVISAAPGGPANRAGILSGDVILAIDDTSTEMMGIYDAAERLQGPEGSSVELTIRSGPEIKHVALMREKVSLNPVKSRLCQVPGSGRDSRRVGYIKLTSFNQNASGAVKEAIDTLRSNSVNAFVLDLRDNSGGLFPEGIEIAKIWLDKGVIVYICDSRGVRDIYDTDGSNAIAASEPLAVLVNKGTASASEILAGALKDNKRAVLFGEPTYGKGKIQSVFELSDGSGLAVTVARYETPAHTDIDKVGVIPDHPLPTTFPKDEEGFCSCLQDPASACYMNRVQLFAR